MENRVFTIGRSPRCDFVVDLRVVSGVHAELHILQDGQLELVDRESTNGTAVVRDGTRVPVHRQQVGPDETVLLGSAEVTLREVLHKVAPDFVPPDQAPPREPTATVQLDLGQERFEADFELLDQVASGALGDTYHALDPAENVVMAHFLAAEAPVPGIVTALKALVPQASRPAIDVIQVRGAPVVITPFIKGFQGLDSAMESLAPRMEATKDGPHADRVASADRPALDAPSPPAPSPHADSPSRADSPGEFTRLFSSRGSGAPSDRDSAPELDPDIELKPRPEDPAPTGPGTSPEDVPGPGAAAPGEFTRLFAPDSPGPEAHGEPPPSPEPEHDVGAETAWNESSLPPKEPPGEFSGLFDKSDGSREPEPEAPPRRQDGPAGPPPPLPSFGLSTAESEVQDQEPAFRPPSGAPRSDGDGARDWGAPFGDDSSPAGQEAEFESADSSPGRRDDEDTRAPQARDWIGGVRDADLSPSSEPPPAAPNVLPEAPRPHVPPGPSPFTQIFKGPPGQASFPARPRQSGSAPEAPRPEPTPEAPEPRPVWHYLVGMVLVILAASILYIVVARMSGPSPGATEGEPPGIEEPAAAPNVSSDAPGPG